MRKRENCKKKYLLVGAALFSLMVTTVYALNESDTGMVNETAVQKTNCPYCENNECPYYENKSNCSNCHQNEHYHGGKGNGYGRQGKCGHHHQ